MNKTNKKQTYKEIVLSKIVLFPKEISELPPYKAIYLYFKVLIDGLKSVFKKNYKTLDKKDIENAINNKPKDCVIINSKIKRYKLKDFVKKIQKDNKDLVDLLHFKDIILYNLKNNKDKVSLIKIVIMEYECDTEKQDKIVIKKDVPLVLSKYIKK